MFYSPVIVSRGFLLNLYLQVAFVSYNEWATAYNLRNINNLPSSAKKLLRCFKDNVHFTLPYDIINVQNISLNMKMLSFCFLKSKYLLICKNLRLFRLS